MKKFAPGDFLLQQEIRGANFCLIRLTTQALLEYVRWTNFSRKEEKFVYSPRLISRSRSRAFRVWRLSKTFLPRARASCTFTSLPLPYRETGMIVNPFTLSSFASDTSSFLCTRSVRVRYGSKSVLTFFSCQAGICAPRSTSAPSTSATYAPEREPWCALTDLT